MVVCNLIGFFRERRAYWKVVHELSNYTARELTDLGISRADIRCIARLVVTEHLPEL